MFNINQSIPLTLRLKSQTTTVFLNLLPSCTIHDLKTELLFSLQESRKHLDPSLIPTDISEIKLALPQHGTADPIPGSNSQTLTDSTTWVPMEINLDDLNLSNEEGGGGNKKGSAKNKAKGRSSRSGRGEGQDHITLLQAGLKDGGILAFRVVKEGEEGGEGFEVQVPKDDDGYSDEEEEEGDGEGTEERK